jgi:hypothetical protein
MSDRYTQGIAFDGAAILKDGVPITIDEIVATLNGVAQAQAGNREAPFVEPEAQGTDAAVKDALIYGTSVMRGGKHTPIQDFYVAPEAAQERHGAGE